MKKHGMLNRDIATVLSHLGHTDQIVIADCGLPIPDGVHCIDLTLKLGEPSFLAVVEEVLNDMAVEQMILAEEIKVNNQPIETNLVSRDIPISYLTHEAFKTQTKQAKVIIRTGEATPYANVILQSGVIF